MEKGKNETWSVVLVWDGLPCIEVAPKYTGVGERERAISGEGEGGKERKRKKEKEQRVLHKIGTMTKIKRQWTRNGIKTEKLGYRFCFKNFSNLAGNWEVPERLLQFEDSVSWKTLKELKGYFKGFKFQLMFHKQLRISFIQTQNIFRPS